MKRRNGSRRLLTEFMPFDQRFQFLSIAPAGLVEAISSRVCAPSTALHLCYMLCHEKRSLTNLLGSIRSLCSASLSGHLYLSHFLCHLSFTLSQSPYRNL